MKFIRNKKGFTLVELLVVLAIIGVVMGLAVGGIRIVQQVNRDTQRKALIRDIQLVLESYQEKHNKYPTGREVGGGGTNTIDVDPYNADCPDGTLISVGPAPAEELCSKVRFDVAHHGACPPTSSATEDSTGEFEYCYDGTAKGYHLYCRLERAEPYNGGNL